MWCFFKITQNEGTCGAFSDMTHQSHKISVYMWCFFWNDKSVTQNEISQIAPHIYNHFVLLICHVRKAPHIHTFSDWFVVSEKALHDPHFVWLIWHFKKNTTYIHSFCILICHITRSTTYILSFFCDWFVIYKFNTKITTYILSCCVTDLTSQQQKAPPIYTGVFFEMLYQSHKVRVHVCGAFSDMTNHIKMNIYIYYIYI